MSTADHGSPPDYAAAIAGPQTPRSHQNHRACAKGLFSPAPARRITHLRIVRMEHEPALGAELWLAAPPPHAPNTRATARMERSLRRFIAGSFVACVC